MESTHPAMDLSAAVHPRRHNRQVSNNIFKAKAAISACKGCCTVGLGLTRQDIMPLDDINLGPRRMSRQGDHDPIRHSADRCLPTVTALECTPTARKLLQIGLTAAGAAGALACSR